MPLDLANLDPCTRRFMLAELDADVATGALYLSPQLSEQGQRLYPRLLRDAIVAGTEDSFAEALRACDGMKPFGRWQQAKDVAAGDALAVAAAILAEREFHRFYLRGLCLRALAQGQATLVIYRARPTTPGRTVSGRTSSDSMLGVRITVSALLEDVRGTFGSAPPHGVPQCRDPGLSVRFPEPPAEPPAEPPTGLAAARPSARPSVLPGDTPRDVPSAARSPDRLRRPRVTTEDRRHG